MALTKSERYPRGTAYHEAGHAVVAWSLGLPIGAVSVSDDDASGGTQIGLSVAISALSLSSLARAV
jgi:ATP-dependent Zn protease